MAGNLAVTHPPLPGPALAAQTQDCPPKGSVGAPGSRGEAGKGSVLGVPREQVAAVCRAHLCPSLFLPRSSQRERKACGLGAWGSAADSAAKPKR